MDHNENKLFVLMGTYHDGPILYHDGPHWK